MHIYEASCAKFGRHYSPSASDNLQIATERHKKQ